MIPIGGIIPEAIKKGLGNENGVITELITNEKLQQDIKDTVIPSFSLSDFLGIKEKIKQIADQMHQQALLTPDPNDDKIDFLKYMYDYVSRAPATHFMPDWFKDIMIYLTAMFNQISHNSVQFVFKKIYEFVTKIVLYTPEWIFNNTWFPSVVSKFSTISIGVVIIFTMLEGIKRMIRKSHTPFSDTLKKLPLAIGVSAATPYLFSNGLKLLNKVTKLILELGSDEIGLNKSHDIFSVTLAFEPLNVLAMLLFTILVSILCVPMLLLHARRWFDLTVVGMLTPLAMSARLFSSTEEYFNIWLRSLKNLTLVQLVYAVFITVLGIIMFATPNPTTFSGVFAKSLFMLGGIYRLAFPPQFVKRFDDNNTGMVKWFKQMRDFKDTKQVKTENFLVESARVAGKGFRFFIKR